MYLNIDIETYSSVNIKTAGLYKYAMPPDFDILLIGYAIDGGTPTVLDLTKLRPDAPDILNFILRLDDTDTIHAYNAAFEWFCLCEWGAKHEYGLNREELLHKMRCTMAHAMYCGYPAGLAATGDALGLPEDLHKMSTGKALIKLFCTPQKPTKAHPGRTRVNPADEPEKWKLFIEYNKQDVVTEMEVERRLSPWPMPDREQSLWENDVRMNARGVRIDRGLVRQALEISAAEHDILTAEAKALTGLANPGSVAQLSGWIGAELGEELSDLRKNTVMDLLETGVNNDHVERMLQLRQQLGKTSTKKYDAMQAAAGDDDRVRGLMQYYGANRTGRWAGRLVQVQNLPQNHLEPLDFAREQCRRGAGNVLRACYGSVPDTLSQLIRTAFIPSQGRRFAIADYSAIEARVIAWLAGEEWVLDVFRTTGKIYEATAAQMFGVPVERIAKGNPEYSLRAKGKVATLALGYGGGESALTAMGALRMGLKEEELPDIKARWRAANPSIVRLWRTLDKAANDVMATQQPVYLPHNIILRYEADPPTGQDFLTIQLPTGRKLFYAHPYYSPSKKFGQDSLHYYNAGGSGKAHGMQSVDTWGGKLAENITQAIARDCLAETLLQLHAAGLDVVFHVHDEVIIDAPDADAALETAYKIMATPLPWAPGLPLKGAGFTCDYYQKD